MKKLNCFDVLIVYTETLAVSASNMSSDSKTPFPPNSRNATYNNVYGYFLEVCDNNNLSVAFTTSADIVGAGLCSSFWIYKNNKWSKRNAMGSSELIFDKFSPTRRTIKSKRELLFSSDKIKSFNDPSLFGLFFDKQKTYEELSEYSIPTVSVEGKTLEDVNNACLVLRKLLAEHEGVEDFTQDIVMKDRFGAGGRHIYKFKEGEDKKMTKMVRRNKKISFIIQPFARFDLGFTYLGRPASTDIRMIFLNGKIVQSYIRMAKAGDFRCNEHQGGSLTYLSPKEISKKLRDRAKIIAGDLDKKSLYALDFIISNNGNVYLLEGNTGPGLDWNESLPKNEREAKKLIGLIVAELVDRTCLVESDIEKEETESNFLPTVPALGYQIVI